MFKSFLCLLVVSLTMLAGCGETPVNEKVKNLDVSEPTIEFGDPVDPGTDTTAADDGTDSQSTDSDATGETDTKDNDATTNTTDSSSVEFAPPKNPVDSDKEDTKKDAD